MMRFGARLNRFAFEGSAENFIESSASEAVAKQLAEEQPPIRALNPGTKFESYEILGFSARVAW
jgi:hypothetical protein